MNTTTIAKNAEHGWTAWVRRPDGMVLSSSPLTGRLSELTREEALESVSNDEMIAKYEEAIKKRPACFKLVLLSADGRSSKIVDSAGAQPSSDWPIVTVGLMTSAEHLAFKKASK